MEDTSFCMIIDDILYIRERGLLAVGTPDIINVSIGDNLYFESSNGELIKDNIRLDGIEVFDEKNIGLFFKIPYIRSKKEGLQVLPIKPQDIVRK